MKKTRHIYGPNQSKKRLYSIWRLMTDRCYNSKHTEFGIYKNKGYTPWKRFIVFRRWALSNGYRDDRSFEILDSHIGYSPLNCYWTSLNEDKSVEEKPVRFKVFRHNIVRLYAKFKNLFRSKK